MPSVTTIEGRPTKATSAPCAAITATPSATGISHASTDGTPATASEPLTLASTPISEPTEMSMLPDTITIDMPIAATAI